MPDDLSSPPDLTRSAGPSSIQWYPGLDGVRAFAILLVFAEHSIPHYVLNLGWTGVNLFFVLSGFLITAILYQNRSADHRFRNFYARRVLRIFPAFYFVWLVLLALTPVLHFQWHPVYALWPLYLGNHAPLLTHSDLPNQLKTVGGSHPADVYHFWSLAVEEQFYLVWAIVVFLVRDRRRLMIVCGIATVFVVLFRLFVTWRITDPLSSDVWIYRSIPGQADALMIGGCMALLMQGPQSKRLLRSATALLLASALIFAIAILFQLRSRPLLSVLEQSTNPWLGIIGLPLINIGAAGFILCALTPGNLIGRVCALPLLGHLGRRSYGFYIYHAVLLTWLLPAHYSGSRSAQRATLLLDVALVFALTYAVSWLSYRFLESPFLRFKSRFRESHPKLRGAQGSMKAQPSLSRLRPL